MLEASPFSSLAAPYVYCLCLRKLLLRQQIEADLLRLEQRVHGFVSQLSDLVQIDIPGQSDANSDIEAECDHLRVGDHYVRVLTIKEAISETKPLELKQLLEVRVNFCVVSEWVPIDNAIARKEWFDIGLAAKRWSHWDSKNSSLAPFGSMCSATTTMS